jgi:DNA-binding HxlR family transcriptional regulator
VAKAAEIVCVRWTPLIVRDLAFGASRFSELQRGVPLASPTLLSNRLKQLEKEGIVQRRKSASGRSWTYHLTPAGEELAPIVLSLGAWSQRWSRRALAKHEIDLGLLLWAIERGARPEAFGPGRTVVQLTLTDQIAKKHCWWFLNEPGRCELCLEAPDQNVDLFLEATLPDMIYAWRGDVTLHKSARLGASARAWNEQRTAGTVELARHQPACPCAIGKDRRAKLVPRAIKGRLRVQNPNCEC